jgi:hypothetical protein
MVTQLRGAPAPVYRVHDGEGRPIGDVSSPRGDQLVGRGAGTVLLVRTAGEG